MHCFIYIHILTIEALSQALFEHTPWGGSSLEPNRRSQHLHAKPIHALAYKSINDRKEYEDEK